MQFYDMHSHILPEFDDGAQSVEESLELIDCLKKQNINNICLTPHFYTNEMSAEDFIEKRRIAYENFLPHIPQDVNVILGTEVFITKYLFNNDDLSALTYGKSNYILTEFSYGSTFTQRTLQELSMLKENYGLIPVLPHVERYEALLNDISLLYELKSNGIIIQTNACTYTSRGSFFKRRKLLKLIKEGLIDILGTDAHSLVHNPPSAYSQALKIIALKCGEGSVNRMMETSEKIFNSAI